jgi:ribose transport system ATP-binding protein
VSTLSRAAEERPKAARDPSLPLLSLSGVSKRFGATLACDRVSFSLTPGEIVGLVGANGAGKSTLMRILAGILRPDEGTFRLGGQALDWAEFSPLTARRSGIRLVHQELSLCESLDTVENFYLERTLPLSLAGWRRRYRKLAEESLAAIFPGHGIDLAAPLSEQTLAVRQMVEIARAAADPALRLLILDEPTSALDAERAAQLFRFVEETARRGITTLVISHKLDDVARLTRRLLVMRNGRLVWDGPPLELPRILALMAGEGETREGGTERREETAPSPVLLSARAVPQEAPFLTLGPPWSETPLTFRRGEVVGLAGLEGNGQRELLEAVARAAGGGRSEGVAVSGRAAFVPGDRRREGIFAGFDVIANTTIGWVARHGFGLWLRPGEEEKRAMPALSAIGVPRAAWRGPVTALSGGNQQKVLFARGLLQEADLLLLDDPTRGVDLAVKAEIYRLIESAARRGALVLWHSSETVELLRCPRRLVFSGGRVVAVSSGAERADEASLLAAAFHRQGEKREQTAKRPPAARRLLAATPYLTVALFLAALGLLNPRSLTPFGLDLLASAALPLAALALGEMLIIGGAEIDLGIGAFAGLINALSATWLVERPGLGALALSAAWLVYALLGLVIAGRGVPALVVTLGASFLWSGLGYTLLPAPGGSAPAWLTALLAARPLGVPASLWGLAGLAALGSALDRSRLGVVLRGFGANPRAMQELGFGAVRFAVLRYASAGAFTLAGGLALTALTTSADVNAALSYTLAAIAAVVVGGSALTGGRTAPAGAVLGAVALSLLGSLLGLFGFSTDYVPLLEGGLLIGVLGLRRAVGGGR